MLQRLAAGPYPATANVVCRLAGHASSFRHPLKEHIIYPLNMLPDGFPLLVVKGSFPVVEAGMPSPADRLAMKQQFVHQAGGYHLAG